MELVNCWLFCNLSSEIYCYEIQGKLIINGPAFSENVSLLGQTAVITGGNTGLGKETALKLHGLGANTIILCRDSEKAKVAIDEINERNKGRVQQGNTLTFRKLDLSSLKSVEECSLQLKKDCDKIDILVNNAGVMAVPTREITLDGFEKTMGINHLGLLRLFD